MYNKTTFFIFFLILFSLTSVSALNFPTGVLNFGEDTAKNVSDFLDLTDTPTTYSGDGGNCVKVNGGETGLEFSSCGAGGSNTTSWFDTTSHGAINRFNITQFTEYTGGTLALNYSWLEGYINDFGFLTSFTETDPFWKANWTAYNTTWSFQWARIDNGTFLKEETNWYNNWTAYNTSWSKGIGWAEATNGTLALNSSLEDYAKWSEVGNGTMAFNDTIAAYVLAKNDSMGTYVIAKNDSLGTYIIAKNDSMGTYVIAKNDSMGTYVRAKNDSLATWVLGKGYITDGIQNNTADWNLSFNNILSQNWLNVSITSSQVTNFNSSLDSYNNSLKNWIDGQVFVKNDTDGGYKIYADWIGVHATPPTDPGITIDGTFTASASTYNAISTTPIVTPPEDGVINAYSSSIQVAGTNNASQVIGMSGLAIANGGAFSGEVNQIIGGVVRSQGIIGANVNQSIGLYIPIVVGGNENWAILDESGQDSNLTNLWIQDNVTADNFLGNINYSYIQNHPAITGITWAEALNGTLVENNTGRGWEINTTIQHVLNDLYVNTFRTYPNAFPWNVYDDGENVTLNMSSVAGNKRFGIITDGANLELYSNPNPSIDYLLFSISEAQGAPTDVNFYEGGTGHNRFWDSGSARFGGSAGSLCSTLTTWVDCDTPATGADVVIQDDIAVLGKVFTSDWTNVSITSSQVSNFNNSLDSYNNSLVSWTNDSFVNTIGDNMTGNLTFETGSGIHVFNGTIYLTNNYNICWTNGTGTCQGYIIRNNSGMYLRG